MRVDCQLTKNEKTRKAELERIIQRGIEYLEETVAALVEVRDAKLWKDEYHDFESYCRGKWNLSPRYVQMLIAVEPVRKRLGSNPRRTALPRNTHQMAALLGLTPSQQEEAWDAAVLECSGRSPPARVVKKHAARIRRRDAVPKSGPSFPSDDEEEGYLSASGIEERINQLKEAESAALDVRSAFTDAGCELAADMVSQAVDASKRLRYSLSRQLAERN